MSGAAEAITAVITAIIGVAILAVLVGSNSNTANVITSFTAGFANILKVAVSPVTGNNGGFN